jgi:aspartate/methionine/tyrosine aminotransferase
VNPRVQNIPPSLIRRIAAKRKPDSIDLGLGEPSLLPVQAHFDAAARDVRERGMRYTPNAGTPDLRAAIAAHYAYPGMSDAQSVCVTVGSQEATYVALATLLDPQRDELLIVEPAFPAYPKIARLEGVAARAVAMREEDDFAFDAERIVAAVGPQTRAIIICSPCNPTGRALRVDQAQLLADALARRGGEPVWLIHDEVYREQTFVDDAAHLADLYPYTISLNSVSKSNALTGLRLGWLIAPPQFVEQAIKVHAWLASCADTFAQSVASDIFATPNGIGEHAGWYRERVTAVRAVLAESSLRALPIDGTFYACVRLRGRASSLETALALADECNVITIPGIAFGECFDQWLRLSWVAEIDAVREGLRRIASWT